ncbi:hypothetical protein BKA57DRAFT_474906 [Linnemannia elongata]|nr:hypothetical protein BKA57DRAFT_474906 [Linnemannia elongata]
MRLRIVVDICLSLSMSDCQQSFPNSLKGGAMFLFWSYCFSPTPFLPIHFYLILRFGNPFYRRDYQWACVPQLAEKKQ